MIEWIIIGLLTVIGLVVSIVIISFFNTWLKAFLAKATVGFTTLLAMRLRGVPVGMIVDARITAIKAGIPLETDQLEAHYLAEGNVVQTVQSLIAASKANIELEWDRACAIDLATRGTSKSVLEAVRTSINPKVIDCMIEGRDTIDGVAKDGIQVKVRVRVTVRSNLDRYVGSAQEETVMVWSLVEIIYYPTTFMANNVSWRLMNRKNQILLISSNYFSRMLRLKGRPHRNPVQPLAVRDSIIFLAIPTSSKISVDLIPMQKNK